MMLGFYDHRWWWRACAVWCAFVGHRWETASDYRSGVALEGVMSCGRCWHTRVV